MSHSEPILMEPDDRLQAEQAEIENDPEYIKFLNERDKERESEQRQS